MTAHLTKRFPPIMSYITTASGSTPTHAALISDSNDLGHTVALSNGVHSYTFNSASNTSAHIAIRAVKIDGTDDSKLFGSYDAAGLPAGIPFTWNTISYIIVYNVSEWSRAELKPSTSSQANGIYSFGLKLDIKSGEEVPSTFEVDNLSVVYRTKNVK